MQDAVCQRYDPIRDMWIYEVQETMGEVERMLFTRRALRIQQRRLRIEPEGPGRDAIEASIRALREGRIVQTKVWQKAPPAVAVATR